MKWAKKSNKKLDIVQLFVLSLDIYFTKAERHGEKDARSLVKCYQQWKELLGSTSKYWKFQKFQEVPKCSKKLQKYYQGSV